MIEEPGRSVADDGRIVYAWPPEGRFAELWRRVDSITTDEEEDELISLLVRWRDDNTTLAAYTDENGEWVDVEPRWEHIADWLAQQRPDNEGGVG